MTKWTSARASGVFGGSWAAARAAPTSQAAAASGKCLHARQGANRWKTGSRAAILAPPCEITAALVTVAARRGLRRDCPSAQAGTRDFTADDMLKVATASVLDLSDDGRRVAVSVRRAYDNAEVDNRRYGDPTYLSPSRVTLQVDRHADRRDPNRPSAGWSICARRRGRTTASASRCWTASNGAPATLRIWDADRKTLTEVPRKAPIASGSALEWTRGRQPVDRRAAQPGAGQGGGRPLQGADRRADHRAVVEGSVPGLGRSPARARGRARSRRSIPPPARRRRSCRTARCRAIA